MSELTRFMLEKPVAGAQLGENARVALSVMEDDGWTMYEVATEINVRVNAVPVHYEQTPADPAEPVELRLMKARHAELDARMLRSIVWLTAGQLLMPVLTQPPAMVVEFCRWGYFALVMVYALTRAACWWLQRYVRQGGAW